MPDADLVLLGVRADAAHRLAGGAALVAPARVHFVVDTDIGIDELRRRVSKRERWAFDRCRRDRAWTWAEVSEPEWFDRFYSQYYRPTMRRRHGEREHVEDAELAYECILRQGRLFALSESGVRVAGALCHWQRATGVMTVRLLGVRDGADEHYRSGAFKATYHFLLRWAAENGVRRLDLQGAEPFLSAGIFQWKRRLGARIVLAPNHFGHKRLCLRVQRDTPAVRDFLVANPILAEPVSGGLEAVYFRDSERPARMDYAASSSGVDRVRIVDLDEFLIGTPSVGAAPIRAPKAPALLG